MVVVAFALMFGIEIWCSWKPPIPAWLLGLHNPLNALASLVGGIVAVAFAIKPPPETRATEQQGRLGRNLVSLGQATMPLGTDGLKEIMGAIYAVVYVVLGFAAIGTWAYLGTNDTSSDVKNLATNFAGMITPIVLGFFSR